MATKIFSTLSVIAAILSVFNIGLGFDKMLNYCGDEFALYNAYVGGDAYNFIINSNYATAYFTLGSMFGIMSVGLLILRTLGEMNK